MDSTGFEGMSLGAVGIEHDVGQWYRNARVANVNTLSAALIDLVAALA